MGVAVVCDMALAAAAVRKGLLLQVMADKTKPDNGFTLSGFCCGVSGYLWFGFTSSR
jgi:hypothetical protein